MAERRTFWPTVLTGAGAAGLAAVASGRDWATASAVVAGTATQAAVKGSDVAPLALALSLVALAGWGAMLVVRRSWRRVVAVIGLLASAGIVVTVLTARDRALDDAVALLAGQPGAAADAGHTAWYYTAAAAALLAAVMFAVAQVHLRAWPEMAARYDAPGAQERQADQTDLWKSLDEGHDPTV